MTVEACILAGGLSTRMGRDKSRILLGRRTMPAQIRETVRSLGLKVRIIRRDLVPRCGPLGGIFTALHTSRADAVLFLACDMPFVPAGFLLRLIQTIGPTRRAVFVRDEGRAGFPFLLRREACLPLVARQIATGEYSLQNLARVLRARPLPPPRAAADRWVNVNTPADLARAKQVPGATRAR